MSTAADYQHIPEQYRPGTEWGATDEEAAVLKAKGHGQTTYACGHKSGCRCPHRGDPRLQSKSPDKCFSCRSAAAEAAAKTVTFNRDTGTFSVSPSIAFDRAAGIFFCRGDTACAPCAAKQAEDDGGHLPDDEPYEPDVEMLPAEFRDDEPDVRFDPTSGTFLSRSIVLSNCGTGAGGFRKGNTCAGEGYGRDHGVKTSRTTLTNIRATGATKGQEYTDGKGRKIVEHKTKDGRLFHEVTHATGRRAFHQIHGPRMPAKAKQGKDVTPEAAPVEVKPDVPMIPQVVPPAPRLHSAPKMTPTPAPEAEPASAIPGVAKLTRLDILKTSLEKKERTLDAKFEAHFDDVKSANGQPLNDKRNGAATIGRWDRQSDGIRTAKAEVEKTKAAIEREEAKIAYVAGTPIPQGLRDMVAAGELVQWRKHPNTFFVPGVDKGRIVWVEDKGFVGTRYHDQVPKDQFAKFREIALKAKASLLPKPAAAPAPTAIRPDLFGNPSIDGSGVGKQAGMFHEPEPAKPVDKPLGSKNANDPKHTPPLFPAGDDEKFDPADHFYPDEIPAVKFDKAAGKFVVKSAYPNDDFYLPTQEESDAHYAAQRAEKRAAHWNDPKHVRVGGKTFDYVGALKYNGFRYHPEHKAWSGPRSAMPYGVPVGTHEVDVSGRKVAGSEGKERVHAKVRVVNTSSNIEPLKAHGFKFDPATKTWVGELRKLWSVARSGNVYTVDESRKPIKAPPDPQSDPFEGPTPERKRQAAPSPGLIGPRGNFPDRYKTREYRREMRSDYGYFGRSLTLARTPETVDVLEFGMSVTADGIESPALGDDRPKTVHGQPVRYLWKQILTPGLIHDPKLAEPIYVSPQDVRDVDRYTREWMKADGGRPYVPLTHVRHKPVEGAVDNPPPHNMGWIVETKVDPKDGSLYGLHQLIGDDAHLAAARHQTSVKLSRRFRSGRSGKVYPWILEHNAFVADPVLEGLGTFEPADISA